MYINDGAIDPVEAAVREELHKRRVDTEVKRRLGLIEDLGSDRFNDGDVIRFTKQFDTGDTVYTYAAIKVNGSWYTTGPKGNKFSWDELREWMVSGKNPTTNFVQLFP
jgi:hypothetical protein